jgi:hypothetical protein
MPDRGRRGQATIVGQSRKTYGYPAMGDSSTRCTSLEIVMLPLSRSHVWGSRTTKELAPLHATGVAFTPHRERHISRLDHSCMPGGFFRFAKPHVGLPHHVGNTAR